jgi:hypothetical protein
MMFWDGSLQSNSRDVLHILCTDGQIEEAPCLQYD